MNSEKSDSRERSVTEATLQGGVKPVHYVGPVALTISMFIVLSAHFLRWSEIGLCVVCLLFPLLLFSRRVWPWNVVRLALVGATLVWVNTGVLLVLQRMQSGRPWTLSALIMGIVGLLSLWAARLLSSRPFAQRHRLNADTAMLSTICFVLVSVLASFPYIMAKRIEPLLLSRFIPWAGWVEIAGLALYAAWLIEQLSDNRKWADLRLKVWFLFSAVFFGQLVLGLAGFRDFLMTGALHIPVPGIILAGPLFRGGGSLFMPILFMSTVLLAGAAWCSWFCYLGSWDSAVSRIQAHPGQLPAKHILVSLGMLCLLTGAAIALRMAGVPADAAVGAGIGFGLGGVAVMALFTRTRGVMIHCTVYCPLGLIARVLGRLNPLRVAIGDSCTECGACIRVCRYGALTSHTIERRKPGFTCTLCGDCLKACQTSQIAYRFPGVSHATAKKVFIVLVVVIHALFLGFARV
jgi:ferredoxin